jgi:hypothetical protein
MIVQQDKIRQALGDTAFYRGRELCQYWDRDLKRKDLPAMYPKDDSGI